MSDTNRVQLAAKRESTPGTAETGAFDGVPFNSASDLALTPEYVQSTEIRSDRGAGKNLIVGQSVNGGFESDLQTAAGDSGSVVFLQSAIGAADDAAGNIGTSFTASGGDTLTATEGNSGTSLTNSGNDLVTQLSGIAAGQMVYIYDTGVDGGDGMYPVTSIFSQQVIIYGCPAFTANTTATIVVGTTLIQGTEDISFTLAKSYLDQDTPLYEYFSGMRVDTASINLSASSLATLAVGFLGETHTFTTSSTHTVNAITSNGPISSAQLVGATMFEADGDVTTQFGGGGAGFITDLTIDIAGNLRERNALGRLTPVGIGQGTVNGSGTLTCYFDNRDLADRVLNSTVQSLMLSFDCSQHVSGGGGIIGVYFPEVVFTQGGPEISGQNEDVIINLNFQAQAINAGPFAGATCVIGQSETL